MKKLHLNKIFHWLYAFLMFLPFILLIAKVLATFGNGSFDSGLGDHINELLYNSIPREAFYDTSMGGVIENALSSVFNMFIDVEGDPSLLPDSVYALFIYWIEISFVYLIFDVILLPINIAHHWIDKGCDRL